MPLVNRATETLTTSYNLWLVALSVAIAVVAAYATLGLAGRLAYSRDKSWRGWLAAGAAAALVVNHLLLTIW